MTWELILTILVKQLAILLQDVNFSRPVTAEISAEIKNARTKEELHAAINKLREKVTP